jgi:general secretion pathway protein N
MKPLLLVTLLGLGGMLAVQWRGWPPERQIAPLDGPGEATQPVNAKPDNPLDRLSLPSNKEDYATVIERPLFLPGRRPPEEAPEAEGPEETSEGQPLVALDTMDLNAVIITPTGAVAWVRTPNDPKPRKVQVGDDLEGWTVKAIATGEVEMQGQDIADRLVLRNYSQGAPPPPTGRPPREAARKEPARPPAKSPQGRPQRGE